jgi:hypothetical protein
VVGTAGFILELAFNRRFWRRAFGKDGTAEFDANFGIDTRASLLQTEIQDIVNPNWIHGALYTPTPVERFREMLAALPIRHQEFTFIDFGSGKGRVLLLASELPFRAIIGLELSQNLHQVTLRNLASYHSETQACKKIDCLLMDAILYDVPLEPSVCYFFNPFQEPVMAQVVRRLEASLEAAPRPMFILYYTPLFQHLFATSKYFREFRATEYYAIYQSTEGGLSPDSFVPEPGVRERLSPSR